MRVNDELILYAPGGPGADDWRVITDSVMGGVSDGYALVDHAQGRECLRLRGNVRLENNGGFVQLGRALDPRGYLDASGYDGFALTVRGNGQRYNLHLRTIATRLPWQSYRAGFVAEPDWRDLRIGFDEFRPHRLNAPLDRRRLARVSVVAIGEAFEVDLCLGRLSLVT